MKTKQSKQPWEIPYHKVLTTEELAQIALENFKAKQKAFQNGDRESMIDWMIFNTSCWGLRISESAQLECGQVFVGTNIAHIRLTKTKGLKPRDVFIGPIFSEFLQEYLEWKQSQGEPVGEHAPFFYSWKTETFMTPEGLRKAFKRAVKKANITRRITPHSGRHTLGTHMVEVNIKALQKLLGHSSLATTEVYIHVLNPKIQEFVEKYEFLIYATIGKKRK